MSRHESNQHPKRRRSKDGCRPCRVRKKKCDGRKPSCVSCERNVLLCSWFPSSTSSGDQKDHDQPGSVYSPDLEGHQDKRRKYSTSTSSSNASVDIISSPHYVFSPVFESGDEGSGVEQQEDVVDVVLPTFESTEYARDISAILRQPALEPIFRSPASLLLYQHWFERTGEAMSAQRGRSNAFVTELPRLAIAYPDTVLQGLLACSGIHYCNGDKTLEMEMTTWSHLGVALRSLKHGLTSLVSQPGVDPVPLLATALVLCFVETTRGDVNGILSHHLRAAHILFNAVMTSRSALLMDQSLLEFLKEFYIYISRITEISCDSERLPYRDQYRPAHDPTSAAPWISNKSFGILIGCAHELFEMIPQVSAYGRKRRQNYMHGKKRHHDSDTKASVEQSLDGDWEEELAYYSLQAKILAWQPPEGSHEDFITCGLIYQQALLCYLDISYITPPITAQSDLPESIKQRFGVLNVLLSKLPLDAPISSTLCWPLALFGSVAREETQRAMVLGRLEAMWQFLRIGNIMATMNLLKRLWGDQPKSSIPSTSLIPTRSPRRAVKKTSSPSDMEGLMKKYALMISFA